MAWTNPSDRPEGFFRALAENLTETVVVMRPEGEILYASPSFLELSGVEPGDARGRSAFDFIHPEDRARTLDAVRMVVDDTHPPGPVRFRITGPSGRQRIMEASGRSLLHHPEVGGVVVSLHDVTDQVTLEERLRATQKMEAVGRLAGGIAHDFNNILTALAGNTEMLLEDVPDDSPIRADLEESRRAIERASGLTRRLLAFSRKQMMVFRVVRLGEVVREIQGLLRRVLESRIDLDVQIRDEGSVRVDVGQLEQVILNLVLNARDAMPRGGTLQIVVERVELGLPESGTFSFPVAAGPYLTLAVIDSGVGMDERTMERLFEPFFTTKPQGKGTGLGLATAYAFAKQSMGYLTAESVPGEGSTFRLYLPRMVEEGSKGSPPSDGEGRPPAS